MTDAIRVTGLREFRLGLKSMDSGLPKTMRVTLNDAAGVIVTDARTRVPRRSGRAAGSIRARSTQTMARVSAGGGRATYYPWLDFGGRVGRRNSVVRPYVGKHGRYIYRAYMTRKSAFAEALSDGLVDLARRSGIDVD